MNTPLSLNEALSNIAQSQTPVNADTLTVATRKALTRYVGKIVGLSLVYNRKMYRHLASVNNADMFLELSIACKRNKDTQGIATVSPTNEVIYVDTLTVDMPILYNATIHTFTVGSMNTQAGVISGAGQTKVSFTVKRDKGLMTIGTISKGQFTSDMSNFSVAQLTALQALSIDVIAKHAEINTNKHWNILTNGANFESKQQVFEHPNNKAYLAYAKVKQLEAQARKDAKQALKAQS